MASPAEDSDVYIFPTSFSQRRLWFLDRLLRDGSVYNLLSAYRLSGKIDVASLEKAFSEVINRHEILRTTFKAADGEPMQIISDPAPAHLTVIDLRAMSPAECELQVQRKIGEELKFRFDLARGPLVRMTLLSLDDGEHVLVKNMHHIITDLWSEEIFLRELVSLYESFSQNKPSALPALPIQYADYSEWEKQNLQGDRFDRQFDYWKRKLGSGLSPLQLQTDRHRPPTPDFAGDMVGFDLSPSTVSALKAISRQQGVTLFITLLTVFKIFLHRFTNQMDIVVGAPIANRGRAEVEKLIGLFLNTLVLRTDLSGGIDFLEALGRVRETALGAFEHQDFPFEMIVEKLQPDRSLSQNPLCQVMFVLQRAAEIQSQGSGIAVQPVNIEGSTTAKFDLTLTLNEKGEGIQGAFIYSTALFDRASIERMVDSFQILLEGAVENPRCRVADLPVLKVGEATRMVSEWNRTETPFPSDKTVHALFEEQVARTPAATALVNGGLRFSYRELNGRADVLAQRLRSKGIGPESLVAVCVERSAEMITAFIAVLKAGGAYVPIDPSDPPERIAFIVEETRSPVFLTERKLAPSLPKVKKEFLFVDDAEAPPQAGVDPRSATDGESTACVIYTSGSTGTPKGVIVPHRAISRLVINTDYAQLKPSDVVAQASNCAFDAATFEIWGALLNGSMLVIIEKETLLAPRAFEGQIARHGINTLFLTTALFNHFAEEKPEIFRNMKHVLFGGEAVNPRAVRAVLDAGAPPENLLHVYGPTEATTFATWHRVTSVPADATTIPIGRPIANTQVYLLDAGLHPVPVGVVGEIYIGGPGLAHGYINASELTASRFIANPFTGDGGRLYKTGDLGRYLADGSLLIVGRVDDQVKIRGFRVEPGEVATVLKQHSDVAETAVIVREDIPGEKRLVAYVVKAAGKSPETGDLAAYLRSRLPDYMVPSTIVFIDDLPLNANGKVDRGALPVPHMEASSASVAPRDTVERELVQIWKDVLGCETVGVKDDFFELGGHSLMAVRLFAEIEKRFGKELPLATLFEAPTIEHLSEVIRQEGWSPDWSPLVSIQPNGSLEPFFCIHGGNGGVLFYSKLASLLGQDQPFYGIQAEGLEGGEIHKRSVEDLSRHYIKEIRSVQPKGPYFIGGYSFGGVAAFEMARQLRAAGEKVAMVALFDANNPSVPARRYTLRERITLRSHAMKEMSLKDRLAFLWKRAVGKFRVIATMKKEKLLRTIYEARMKGGETLPANYRSLCVHQAHVEMLRGYTPGVCEGKITLFRAGNPNDGFEFDPHLGWDGHSTEGLEIIDVPGEHETMFQEPHVKVLAEKMKSCFEKTRSHAAPE